MINDSVTWLEAPERVKKPSQAHSWIERMEMGCQVLALPNESATQVLGAAVARACTQAMTLYLQGELGAGKTTFCRGFLAALGHQGSVKSPTYTLVEPYSLPPWQIYHFDLYRIADPAELELIGIRDYQQDNPILLIEWPQQGGEFVPEADITLQFRTHSTGRQVRLQAHSPQGQHHLQLLTDE
jgi:tRNA threonylcarbamoyladenosine biosynthesis protein TsaE